MFFTSTPMKVLACHKLASYKQQLWNSSKMVKKQNWFLLGFLSCRYAGFPHYGELNLKALVGRRIRELRNRRGITQAVLAEKADLSIEFIGRVERGKHIPSLCRMCRICMALNCTLGDFFNHADFTYLNEE